MLIELQVGSYVFMDRQYRDVWTKPGDAVPFETSLFVQTTVISANRDGLATTDAGFKSFATDAGAPEIANRRAGRSELLSSSATSRAGFFIPSAGGKLVPGHVLTCVVPHCDPTVNLCDALITRWRWRQARNWPSGRWICAGARPDGTASNLNSLFMLGSDNLFENAFDGRNARHS